VLQAPHRYGSSRAIWDHTAGRPSPKDDNKPTNQQVRKSAETAYHFHDGLLPGDAAYKLGDVDAKLSGGCCVTDGSSP